MERSHGEIIVEDDVGDDSGENGEEEEADEVDDSDGDEVDQLHGSADSSADEAPVPSLSLKLLPCQAGRSGGGIAFPFFTFLHPYGRSTWLLLDTIDLLSRSFIIIQ